MTMCSHTNKLLIPVQNFISRTPIITQSEFAINYPNPTLTNSTATLDQTKIADTSSDTTNSPMPTQELNIVPFKPPSTSEPNTTPTQNQFSNQPLPQSQTELKKIPTHLQDFVCQQAALLPHSQELDRQQVTISSGNPFPLRATLSYHNLSTPLHTKHL